MVGPTQYSLFRTKPHAQRPGISLRPNATTRSKVALSRKEYRNLDAQKRKSSVRNSYHFQGFFGLTKIIVPRPSAMKNRI